MSHRSIEIDNELIRKSITDFMNDNYSYLFKSKRIAYIFSLCIYYFNNEEFEATYNDLYFSIKHILNDERNVNIDKKKIIDSTLNSSQMYIFYKTFFSKQFDIRVFFKSKKDYYFFIKKSDIILNDIKTKGSYATSPRKLIYEMVKNFFKNFFTSNVTDNNIEKIIDKINKEINNAIQRNFKKIHRLYSLF